MTAKYEEKVAAIEARLAEIGQQIADLQAEREHVLMSDKEYAQYLDQYRAFYEDEPFPIRQYYEHVEELERIIQEVDVNNQLDSEAAWQKHKKRIAYLERRLAA